MYILEADIILYVNYTLIFLKYDDKQKKTSLPNLLEEFPNMKHLRRQSWVDL